MSGEVNPGEETGTGQADRPKSISIEQLCKWSEVIANLEQVSVGFGYIIFYTFYTGFFFLFRWFQLLSVVYCHTRIHTEKLANK